MDPDELSRGEAREGTTWFHRYATLYVVAAHCRYTAAVRFVRGSETATEALMALLGEAMGRGLRPRTVYADKGFCTLEALGWLMDHVEAFVVPLPLRGSRARALCRGRGGRWTSYTLGPGSWPTTET
jgi:hypothetical protein